MRVSRVIQLPRYKKVNEQQPESRTRFDIPNSKSAAILTHIYIITIHVGY